MRFLGFILTITLERVRAGCGAAPDCSLNGICSSSGRACICDAGWTGSDCAVLKLRPAESASPGYHLPGGGSAWGMSVTKDHGVDAGGVQRYHGFVSAFLNKCKLGSWTTNSYVQHIVSDSPTGPWTTLDAAVGAWSHNPRIVWSPLDSTWVLFHIGSGLPTRPIVNCSKATSTTPKRRSATVSPTVTSNNAAPFAISTSKSLSGPWTTAPMMTTEERHEHMGSGTSLLTMYPGVDNVGVGRTPEINVSGTSLKLFQRGGSGVLLLNLSTGFKPNPHRGGALAWDACGAETPRFDNGALVETASGSHIGAFQLITTTSSSSANKSKVGFLAGSPCDVTYTYNTLDLRGPFHASDGVVNLTKSSSKKNAMSTTNEFQVNYFEIPSSNTTPPIAGGGVIVLGTTQDAAGCRGACETHAKCTSFTWIEGEEDVLVDEKSTATGVCYARTDGLWAPNATAEAARSTSGRPWTFDGDNPAPWIDSKTGAIRVLYRTDSDSAAWVKDHAKPQPTLASLVGIATAPSWRGPYTIAASKFGGPISAADYPWEENEDPFLWRNARGEWHALFHANTWGDSRNQIFPVAGHAGRHAFSADGERWSFSRTPAFNGTVQWSNGSSIKAARRERPFLIFDDETHAPTHLFTGVQVYADDDATFNLVQEILV